jgi:hypothetical protein
MDQDSPNPVGFRESILRESFDKIGFEEAVGLVGILFEHRIVFADKVRGLFTERNVRLDLEPLEPQAASILVGNIFGMDCDQLFLEFTRNWGILKHSPMVKGLIASIQSHKHVKRLDWWP